MRNKWKIVLSIVVALLLGVGVYAAYIFKFKEYDVADEAVDEIVENPYEVELPDGSKLVIGEDGSVTTEADAEGTTTGTTDSKGGAAKDGSSTSSDDSIAGATPVSKTETPSSTAGSSDKGNTNTSDKGSSNAGTESQKPTVAEVKAKYEPVFSQLEGQADSKINSLIGRAKKEYSDKKASGASISYGYFYNKYMGAANALEANTDAVFYGVVQAVEAELAANGYSKSHAKSFVEHYEATKKARRDGILKKVAGRS